MKKIKKVTAGRIFRFLAENILSIICIFYCAFRYFLKPIDNEPDIVNLRMYLDQTVALLMVINIANIIENFSQMKVRGDLSDIKEYFVNTPKKELEDYTYYLHDNKFKNMVENAREIRICGNSLNSTLYIYRNELREAKMRGCKIRIIIVDPAVKVVMKTIENNYRGQDTDESPDKVVNRSIKILRKIQNEPGSGSMAIAYLPHLMNYGLIILNGYDVESTFLLKKTYSHKKHTRTPTYYICSKDKFFNHFCEEFEFLWGHSEEFGRIEN